MKQKYSMKVILKSDIMFVIAHVYVFSMKLWDQEALYKRMGRDIQKL